MSKLNSFKDALKYKLPILKEQALYDEMLNAVFGNESVKHRNKQSYVFDMTQYINDLVREGAVAGLSDGTLVPMDTYKNTLRMLKEI